MSPKTIRRSKDESKPVLKPKIQDCGHGHVHIRKDGITENCGGPMICLECKCDLDALFRIAKRSMKDISIVTK